MGDLTTTSPYPPTQLRTGGRPTIYNQETAEAICLKLARGMTKRGACGLVNVDEETFRSWQERDDFSQMVARAEATAEAHFTEVLVKAAGGTQGQADYRAGVEWLKRRRRADYGDTLDVRRIDTQQLMEFLTANTPQQSIAPADTELLTEEDVL